MRTPSCRLAAVVAAPLVAAATMCVAVAPPASADASTDFLTVVAKGGITVPAGKERLVVQTGRAVCTEMTGGETYAQEIADLTSVTGWSPAQARYFVAAATVLFCPDQQTKVPPAA